MSHILKSALVPSSLLEGKDPGRFLAALYVMDGGEDVAVEDLHMYGASLVYVRDNSGREPALATLVKALPDCGGYNKILAMHDGDALYLAVAQGDSLKLAAVYPAGDFTTAEYYIFLAIKALQINPELSVIRFASPLTEEQEMSLGRYFHGVEVVLL